MVPVTVTIITKNEAQRIGDALDSVAWADEVIVVDAESTDDTVPIARQRATHVFVRPWPGYGAQKNFAADQARHDWILSVDADERITPALAGEIQALVASPPAAHAYRIPRVSRFLGRWIRSTDWHPDLQLRLYDRRHARWNARPVHELIEVEGPTPTLRGELQHLPYRDLSHYLSKIDGYTTLAAQQMQEEGRRAGVLSLLSHPPVAFLRNYVLKGGVRDGIPGLIVSLLNSYYVMLKFAKLWERQPPI